MGVQMIVRKKKTTASVKYRPNRGNALSLMAVDGYRPRGPGLHQELCAILRVWPLSCYKLWPTFFSGFVHQCSTETNLHHDQSWYHANYLDCGTI